MIVVDASIVFKWFDVEEENRQESLHILENHLLKENEILIPSLLLYELTNAWVTKSSLSLGQVNANLSALEKYELSFVSVDFDLMKTAAEFARNYQVSVYDAAYAVVAKEKKCDLITADEKFVNKTSLEFIKSLG